MGILDEYLKKSKEGKASATSEREVSEMWPSLSKPRPEPKTILEIIWAVKCDGDLSRYDRRDPWYVKHEILKKVAKVERELQAGLELIKRTTVIQDVKDLCDDMLESVKTEWRDDENGKA